MATSPPPPYSATLPNPKKRPSMSAQPSMQGASKRPKLHPLRQTSFPVTQDGAGAYGAVTSARSETGSVANSLISTTSSKVPGRGRGRPRKSTQINDDDIRASQTQNADSSSQVEGSARNGGGGGRGTKSVVSARSGVVEGDDDDEGDIDGMLGNMDEQDRKQAEEEESRQEQRRDRLTDTFDADQYSRYSQWRALTLNKNTVKKLVNGIVSQSVTQAPLQAINIYGKWFVGEIVERAREVQMEYAAAYEETRAAEKIARREELARLEERQLQLQQPQQQQQQNGATVIEKATDLDTRLLARDITRLQREVDEYIPNPHRGGLLPDHLREALRRYKADGEGGGVGFEGSSHGLLGVGGSATWRTGDGASGRRLFR